MARTASVAHPVQPLSHAGSPLVDSILVGDHIGFEAWLLPPETHAPTERAIRLCSVAAGPVAFAAALACLVSRIV